MRALEGHCLYSEAFTGFQSRETSTAIPARLTGKHSVETSVCVCVCVCVPGLTGAISLQRFTASPCHLRSSVLTLVSDPNVKCICAWARVCVCVCGQRGRGEDRSGSGSSHECVRALHGRWHVWCERVSEEEREDEWESECAARQWNSRGSVEDRAIAWACACTHVAVAL